LGQPRILFIDIETAPIIMAAWTTYEANAVYILRDTYIISVAYKWLGERWARSTLLPDFPRYKKHKHCDRDLCRIIWGLLDEADIVIAHNGDRFDIPKINSRLIVHGHPPPSQYKTVDTLKAARKVFKFDSNKLDNIGRYLSEGRKIANTGGALWRACCEDGDPKAWRTMGRYNRRDVDLLASTYERFKPWMTNHPNLNLYTNAAACPTCQSNRIKRRGLTYSKSMVRQRWQCLDCWSAWSGEVVKPGERSCESHSRPARATRGGRAASLTTKHRKTGSRKTRSMGRGMRRRTSDRR
jgi:hypothetical protein